MLSVAESSQILASQVSGQLPELLIVLGSGWDRLLAVVQVEQTVDYQSLFGVGASVPGHAGQLIIGRVGSQRVALMSGRFHTYEGYSPEEVTRPIQVFAAAGVKKLVLTAACGAVNEKYQVGDLVLLSDLLTVFLSPESPLIGPKFQDLSEIFDQNWRLAARRILAEERISFREGIYGYYHGPNYESPADKMAFKILGADVVGMSTVPETLMAKWLGLKVLGLALVTNLAFVKHDHRQVLAAAEAEGGKLANFLQKLVENELAVAKK